MLVPLTKGLATTIDDSDAERVSGHVWRAHRATTARENWYAYTKINGKKVYLHRFLTDAPKGLDVDHIDGDGLNNRRENMRVCTRSQNNQNSIQFAKINGYRGVCYHADRKKMQFSACVWIKRKRIRLGYFATEELAASARDEGARRVYGDCFRANAVPEGLHQ